MPSRLVRDIAAGHSKSSSGKRTRDPPISTISPASRRSSGRAKVTPKKSQYFTGSDLSSRSSSEASDDDVADDSGYDDRQTSEPSSKPSGSEREGGGDFDSQDPDVPARKRQKNTSRHDANKKTAAATPKEGQELWRPSVKTGLGPGTKVVIEKPKARPEGDTRYKEDRIHPNTILFLKELAENNEREWLKMHDPDYRTSWNDFTSWLECLQSRITEIDETVPELPLKDIIFRIYRDVRFSPDPTPYKPQFSACLSRTGRKSQYAVYYVQIKAGGQSLAAGGLWMPDASQLAAVRRSIDQTPNRIKEVFLHPAFRKEFLANVGPDAKKVVKAFTKHNSDSMLKTRPKGYEADHQEIELLRLKNFTIGRRFSDKEVVADGFIDQITHLNSVVMPDE